MNNTNTVISKPKTPWLPFLNRKSKEAIGAYFMILPVIFGLILFTIVPFIASIFISLTQWDVVTPAKWIGIDNFRKILVDDIFIKALANTLYFTVATVPLSIILGLGVALALNLNIKGLNFFRSAFYLPVITSTVAVATVWLWLYNTDFGLINYFLSLIGIQGPGWLSDSNIAMPSIIIFNMWRGNGYNILLYLAALQGIPQDLYESAYIDGASPWQRTWNITIPMVSHTTFFIIITCMISCFQVFEQCYILTAGGPYYATTTVSYQIYLQAFSSFRMGYASALSWILFIFIAVCTAIQFKFQKKIVILDD